MHMPPPVHGAAVVGQQIHDSQLIRDNFECAYINASTSTALDNVGHFSLKKISRTLSFYEQVLKTLRDQQPDLVYFTPSTSGFAFYRDCITIRMLRRHKQNIILHLHNKPKESFLHKWYNQWLWRKFFIGTSVIFLGKALADQFSRFTTLCKHVYICPNGMPNKMYNTPVRQERNAELFTFLFLSNMIESKGVYVLLDACALLKRNGYSFRCNFVGQRPENPFRRTERRLSRQGEKSVGVYLRRRRHRQGRRHRQVAEVPRRGRRQGAGQRADCQPEG